MFRFLIYSATLLFPLFFYFSIIKQLVVLERLRKKSKYYSLVPIVILCSSPYLYFTISRSDLPTAVVVASTLLFSIFVLALLGSVFFLMLRPFFFLIRKFGPRPRYYGELVYLFIFACYSIFALITAHRDPVVEENEIKVANFPFQNFRIVQLTDLHFGPYLRENFLETVAKQVEKLDADLILITGDIIDKDPHLMGWAFSRLAKLPSKLGVYYSLGNHEYYSDVIGTIDVAKKNGLKGLINDSAYIERDGTGFYLVGVNDLAGNQFELYEPNVDKAFAKVDFTKAVLTMLHRPSQIITLPEVDVVFSGHTHGGQIYPIKYVTKQVETYVEGIFQHSKRTQIAVSRGAGFWGPALRLPSPGVISVYVINKQ